MSLNTIDWMVIIGYLLINLLIGMYYRRRASGNTEDFFLSGREVSWWLAGYVHGGDYVCRGHALLVSGLVATQGIAGNWIWWSMCLSGMLTVFFFARYWRRAEVLTDVELAEVRYSGRPAAFLRGFKAVYLGLIMNCLILGWVTNAMVSIVSVLLGPLIEQGRVLQITVGNHTILHYVLGAPSHTALFICVFILIPFTGIYTSLGGLWGVLVTDLFQFILKMAMVVVLAWTAVSKIGGMAALKLQLEHVSRGDACKWGRHFRSAGVLSQYSSRLDNGFTLDFTPADVHYIPGFAVVVGVVPGSRTGGRRLCCAKNVFSQK